MRRVRFILAAAVAALAVRLLIADGGTLQFQAQSGGYIISLFSSPVPLRAGPADLSVMVQNSKHQSVLDARVLIHVSRLMNSEIREIVVPATREHATNKLLYAASLTFPSAGDWNATIDVTANGQTASVSGELHVLPQRAPLLTFWPFFIAIPVLIALFSLNQWLKRKRRARSSRVLP